MGLFKFDVEDTIGCAWLLESFQRRFSQSSTDDLQAGTEDKYQFSAARPFLVANGNRSTIGSGSPSPSRIELTTRDEYLAELCAKIRLTLEGTTFSSGQITRALNEDSSIIIRFPEIQGHLLRTVPQGVMNFYWNLNQQSFFMKQMTINNFLQIEHNKFLTKPTSELKQFLDNHHCLSPNKPKSNNDASRRSRIKKRINTELLLESYECDQLESGQLDDEEQQLHLVIALLEDKVFELTGNSRLIAYYRDLSCLA